jgi:hypothetical protein
VILLVFFCGLVESIDHLFVHYSIVRTLWECISHFNKFEFQGQQLEDLLFIDCYIHLKDKLLVELLRSVICWVL